MEAVAELQSPDDGERMLVYEGALTKLVAELELSSPYYTKVTGKLRAMGCIRQLRRGGGNGGSQWQLITAPTVELYDTATAKPGPKSKKTADMARDQQIADLGRRLLQCEKALGLVNP